MNILKSFRNLITFGIIIIVASVPFRASALSIGLSAPHRFELGVVHPSKLYEVGAVTVINTDDKYGCFKMNVAYHQDQPELRIPKEWVVYTPNSFCLESGKVQLVHIELYPKRKTRPGNYFAYLEACTDSGGFVGLCVATKLYFTLNHSK